ncbi:hypothetical protein K492DRAFT_220927 [Lichtheimia hyalospora FSU 10163]|nr:hypothetical protein K492DRAFT_220927 [Lichtheimia hyalospora FSU 10163]
MSCAQGCVGMSCEKTCNDKESGETDLSAERAMPLISESSTPMLQDEDNDDDIPFEYAIYPSNDEDCDDEYARSPPNALSKTASQIPTLSPFETSGQDEVRPTVTAYTTITSEIISPSTEMLHTSSNKESDVIESNGSLNAGVSISALGVITFVLVWLP